MHKKGQRKPTIAWAIAVLVGVGGFGSAVFSAQTHAGEYAQADIEFGAGLYNANCVTCHGANGDGVADVSLRSGQFRNASNDRDLTRIFRSGIANTPMPPGSYSAAELTGLVAFVRTMGDIDPATLTVGDAARGQAVYNGTGDCASCHRIRGQGSRLAPDLSDVGTVRSAGALERSLLDPTGSMLPKNRSIRAVTRDGRTITGRRINEDTYAVQIFDETEHLVSVDKTNLREYTVLTTSPMPSYEDQLTQQELSDLLAYLLSLKGV